MENKWKEKSVYGQYVSDMTGVDWEKTWHWLRKGELKGSTEALICSARKQALRVRSIGKSGFRFSKSKSGFPNRTLNPKTDFNSEKSVLRVDFGFRDFAFD